MTWTECMNRLMENHNEKVYFDGYIYDNYNKSPRDAKRDINKKNKATLIKRLSLIFKDIDKKDPKRIFTNIKETELQLFSCLLYLLPRRINSVENGKSVDVYKVLYFDYWEHLPLEERQIIINHIELVKNDGNTINKYIFATKDNDKQKIFESIRTRILYPKYYRLMKNVFQLVDIFSMNYHQLIDKIGIDAFLNFEKDLNNLLRKYETNHSSIIRGYPRTEEEIDAEIEVQEIPALTEEDFFNIISDVIT